MEIHPSADVQSNHIGHGTQVWQFAVILPGARIGSNCNINCHTFIENDVVIGNNVTVKSGTYIWDAIRIEDDVFVGPNVVFTNDLRPRSRTRVARPLTTIRKGASLGANSTILAGVTVGAYAMTGMASVVTRDVPDYALVYGSPARVKGWIDEKGRNLTQVDEHTWENEEKERYEKTTSGLRKI